MRRVVCLVFCLLLGACPALAQAVPKYVLAVETVALSRASASVYAGQRFTLQAKVSPPSRAHEAVLWQSSDPAVATVKDGVVTAVAPGAARITATVEDQAAACQVTVRRAVVKAIRLNATQVSLSPADTFQLSVAAFSPSYAADGITWASQDESVAAVDADTGLITAVGLGATRIRARTAGGKTAFCSVTVNSAVRARAVKLSAASKNLTYHESYRLTASVSPASAIAGDKVLAWRSSKPDIASVDDTGLITAGDRPGTTVITAATANGRSAKCKVTVKYLAVKGLALSESRLLLNAGETASLTAALSPANATDGAIVWRSSDESVATVSGGAVSAHQSGTARVTATAGGKSASCTVTVRSIQAMVTITAAGDITIGGDPRKQDPASESWYGQLYSRYGGDFLGNLSEVFERSHEITLVNLESNLTSAGKYANKAYVLRGQSSYASILARAGVEVVGHANNHSADFGAAGAKDTRAAVTGQGMSYVSGAITATRQVNGVKVGFCAFNQTGGNVTGAMQAAVKKLKAGGCDIVVVSLHWGAEYAYAASAAQRNLGRAAVSAGADLVVGHHSHVVSGVEKYKGKYIVYGLGTLSSALLTPDDMDALLFQQTFKVDVKSGLVESGQVALIPVSMSTDENANDAKPYILAGAARQRVLDKVKYYSRGFAETLPDKCFG